MNDAEDKLKVLRHVLKMLRAEKNQRQREIFEIDSRIEDILLNIIDIQNQLHNKMEIEYGTRI